jgi:hypothetical protein
MTGCATAALVGAPRVAGAGPLTDQVKVPAAVRAGSELTVSLPRRGAHDHMGGEALGVWVANELSCHVRRAGRAPEPIGAAIPDPAGGRPAVD